MTIVIRRVLVSWWFLLLGAAPGLAQSAPTNFQATVQGPTEVNLSWNAVAGTTGYHVFRAVGAASFVRLTTYKIAATSYPDASATPSTTFRYRVAAVDASGLTYYSAILTVTTPAASLISSARISSAARKPPPQGIAVAVPSRVERRLPTSGRYRLSIAGFTVNSETYDDPLQWDGKRDEVYVAAVMQRFNRKTGALVDASTVQSKVYGDANGFPDRVPQGRASDVGGLMTGDVVPFGWDERSILPSPNPGWFPMILWEGSLANEEDALVLRPTIWEWDGNHATFNYWQSVVTGDAPATWQYGPLQNTVARAAISEVERDGEAEWILWSTGVAGMTDLGGPSASFNAGRDRPVGVKFGGPAMTGAPGMAWFDRLLVLTREKIENELSKAGVTGGASGLLPLRFVDSCTPCSAALSGDYTVYLRLERVP